MSSSDLVDQFAASFGSNEENDEQVQEPLTSDQIGHLQRQINKMYPLRELQIEQVFPSL
jgi:hypothetical protein